QVVAEELPDVLQHGRVARRVEAVAAVVHVQAGQLEAAGEAADVVVAFQHRGAGPLEPGQLKGSPHAGRPRAPGDDLGPTHAMYLSCQTMKFKRPHKARPLSFRPAM